MFKLIAEVLSLALVVLALVGTFAEAGQRTKFSLIVLIAALAYGASRTVVPGHETVTLLVVAVLLLLDFVWLLNTFAAAHGVSLFGWIQGHKDSPTLAADVSAAKVAATAVLKTDAQTAEAVATSAATTAATAVVGAAANAAADAVKAGVENAIEKK